VGEDAQASLTNMNQGDISLTRWDIDRVDWPRKAIHRKQSTNSRLHRLENLMSMYFLPWACTLPPNSKILPDVLEFVLPIVKV